MSIITSEARFRQRVIKYSLKYGVTKAAIRCKTNRQYIYRWRTTMGTLEQTLNGFRDTKGDIFHRYMSRFLHYKVSLIPPAKPL